MFFLPIADRFHHTTGDPARFSRQENDFTASTDIQIICHYLQRTVRSQDGKGEKQMKRIAINAIAMLLVTGTLFAGERARKDIVDTAVAAGSFSTLAAALEA